MKKKKPMKEFYIHVTQRSQSQVYTLYDYNSMIIWRRQKGREKYMEHREFVRSAKLFRRILWW